jgi:alpha-glucosidase
MERIARAAIEQRYQLLPYLYTAAWQASTTGAPVVRPMSFVFPDDARFAGVDDQFLCGDALLVAPVLEPGATARSVVLPHGAWFDLATGARHEGGGRVDVQAPLHIVPVFVRGGAVIPRWNVQQYVGEGVQALEVLACVVPGVHTSLLYEDDGVTRGGPFRVSRFVLDGAELRRTVAEGDYQPTVTQVRVGSLGRGGLRELHAPGDFVVRLD